MVLEPRKTRKDQVRALKLTSADLVVLSLLAEEPMHGYRIVSELERRDAKDWGPVSKPQVYYSLKKLVQCDYVTPVLNESGALGPERESYRITTKGFKAMNRALTAPSWALQRPPPPFMTWMALSSHLSSEETDTMIKTRKSFLERELAREKKTLADFEGETDPMVASGRLMVSFAIRSFELELNWLIEVRKELLRARRVEMKQRIERTKT